MKFRLVILFILFLGINTTAMHAQWDPQVSQYWRIKNFYNPSFISNTENIESMLLHRIQWVGIEDAPVTSMISAYMPFDFMGKTHSVGAMVMTEKIGLFSNTSMQAQYAYKFRVKKNKYLSFGLQAGLMNIDFDASKIEIPDGNGFHQKEDPAIPTASGSKKFDVGLGLAWIAPSYYIGVSTTHLLEPKFDLDDNRSAYVGRAYYLVGGYNIKLGNPFVELQPSALFKTDAVTYQLDVTARLEYNKMFNGGISWRKDDGFVFLLGVKIKSIDAGYSYDLPTSAISKVSSGSHELFLRYSIPIEKRKVMGSSKSIRIL